MHSYNIKGIIHKRVYRQNPSTKCLRRSNRIHTLRTFIARRGLSLNAIHCTRILAAASLSRTTPPLYFNPALEEKGEAPTDAWFKLILDVRNACIHFSHYIKSFTTPLVCTEIRFSDAEFLDTEALGVLGMSARWSQYSASVYKLKG